MLSEHKAQKRYIQKKRLLKAASYNMTNLFLNE